MSDKNDYFKENASRISSLSLKCYSKEEIFLSLDVLKSFKYFENLSQLKINGIVVDVHAARIISQMFPRLQELILSNCKLDSNSAKMLFSCEQRLPAVFRNLTRLDVSYNFIENDAVNSIVMLILQKPKLTKFCFDGNECGKHLKAIINNLDWKIAKSTDLFSSTSELGEINCISAFFTILSSAKEISSENIQVNNIIEIEKLKLQNLLYKKPTLTENASYLFKRFTALRELHMYGIRIEESAASVMNIALTNHLSSLQALTLSDCMLDTNLCKILLHCNQSKVPIAFKTLKSLDLNCNQLTNEAMEPLILCFIQMSSLRTLSLDGNNFSKVDIKAILDEISKFKPFLSKIYRNDQTLVNSVSTFIMLLSKMKNLTTEVTKVKIVTEIKSLILVSTVCSELYENAALFFLRFSQLSTLQLVGIELPFQSIVILSNALTFKLDSLEELKLSNCKLDSKSAIRLLSTDEVIPVCFKTLRIINFSDNFIANDALHPLFNSFLQMPKLEVLHLNGNSFTTVVPLISILFDCRSNKTLEIDYSNRYGSRICITAFLTLLSCIKTNSAVKNSSCVQRIAKSTVLNLEYYHYNPIVLTDNSARFFPSFRRLLELNLSGIHIIPKAITSIACTLQNNPRLLRLKLSSCQLDSDSAITLFSLCNSNVNLLNNLVLLDISHNNIDDKATKALIKLLLQITKLTTFNFIGNKFSSRSAKELHRILSQVSNTYVIG